MLSPKFNPTLFISSRCAQTITTQRLGLARFAALNGWAVQFGGDCSIGDFVANLNNEGFSFHPLPVNQRSLNPFGIIRLIGAYAQALRRLSPSVFHAFTIKPLICGLLGARIAGVPVRIATVPGQGHIFLSSSRLTRLIAKLLFKFAFLYADRVIFYNEADRDDFVARRLLPQQKTLVIAGSGIDTNRFASLPMPNDTLTHFVFVGRLLREKGLPELLDAMRIIMGRKGGCKLHIVGDCDPNNPSTLSLQEIELAVADGLIIWHGMVADVRPLVAQAHIVILPSHREGIPLALLEGAAMGRALIATDVPGCRDVVVPGVTGLLVPPHDAAALAEAMIELASDRARIEQMGAAARADVVARFDTQVVNAKVLEVYEAFLEQHHTRTGGKRP